MSQEHHYAGIGHIVQIMTHVNTVCKDCDRKIGPDDFVESVNHYLQKHDYKLLHVGTETTNDMTGKAWHNTVAILGK